MAREDSSGKKKHNQGDQLVCFRTPRGNDPTRLLRWNGEMTRLVRCLAPAFALGLALLVSACAGNNTYIRGTQVPDTAENRDIVRTVEKYRLAVEAKDTATLIELASKNYWEDGGTPTGGDDYGYEGLREVLAARLSRAHDIRYSLKYVNVIHKGSRAYVDVLVDASFGFDTERGPTRRDMRDQNQLVLERQNQRWVFVSGM
jgi:hypothetical protein